MGRWAKILPATVAVVLVATVALPFTRANQDAAPAAAQTAIEYFALGDSIASGHGLMDDASSQQPSGCRRSENAYPYQVAARIQERFPTVAVNFPSEHFLACSGATVRQPNTLPHPNLWLRNQVEGAQVQILDIPPDRPVLVSVTIGANDFEWGPEPDGFFRLFALDEVTFRTDMIARAGAVRESVVEEVTSLLAYPNVRVVITEYANPFNQTSVFFRFGGPVCEETVGSDTGLLSCYARTEYGADKLNEALRGAVDDLAQPDRVAMTDGLRAAFRGHEAPQPMCGGGAPDVAGSWIQYRDDPASNADPTVDRESWDGGDCIHPQGDGVRAYADAALQSARSLLPALLASPSDATPPADVITPAALSVYEVVGRAQAAITQAGTYRFQLFSVEGTGRTLGLTGEVDIKQGQDRSQAPDGSLVSYFDGTTLYERRMDGTWSSSDSPRYFYEPLFSFLRLPATEWTLEGSEVIDGRESYVITRTFTYQVDHTETYWIDAETFLPIKRTSVPIGIETSTSETVYSDFGAPVDVEVPAEAFASEQATATAVAAGNKLRDTIAQVDPDALVDWLQAGPLPNSELPPGFTNFEIEELPPDEQAPAAVGGAKHQSQEGLHAIVYQVFSADLDAQAAYDDYQAGAVREGGSTSYPSGFDYPSVTLSGYADGHWLSVCMVQVGNLLVWGISALSSGSQEQADINATDLVRAGLDYLEQLLGYYGWG